MLKEFYDFSKKNKSLFFRIIIQKASYKREKAFA